MKLLPKDTKFAHLGKPGTAFSKGFERRLRLLQKKTELQDKKILDQGSGLGVWLYKFAEISGPKNVFGFDIDEDLINEFKINNKDLLKEYKIPEENVVVSKAEDLPYTDGFFDIVFSNEVLEHVEDDSKSVNEVYRILNKGGKFIIFTPNSGWPFETHGIFWKGKYIWGNIPFLPWMPKSVFSKYAPHVRNYSNKEVRGLLESAGFKIVHHKHVFPGFDGMVRRFGFFGKIVQKFFHLIEKTPLHWFGISHFIIAEK